ncbi:hypothetical protein GQ457_10G021560 [Hibiscus cannabinus]
MSIALSRFIVHLSVTVKSYGKYFRGLQVGLVSPHFVFNVGNIVVINHSGCKGWPVFASRLIFTMNSSERAKKTGLQATEEIGRIKQQTVSKHSGSFHCQTKNKLLREEHTMICKDFE